MHKKRGKKLTNVSFMYVCVAENCEMLVFFPFFPNNSSNRQLSFRVKVLNHVGWYLDHKGLLGTHSEKNYSIIWEFFPNNSLNRQLSFRVEVLNHMGWYLGHKGLLYLS